MVSLRISKETWNFIATYFASVKRIALWYKPPPTCIGLLYESITGQVMHEACFLEIQDMYPPRIFSAVSIAY
jgi:trans-2-enoyl-CoA reductase